MPARIDLRVFALFFALMPRPVFAAPGQTAASCIEAPDAFVCACETLIAKETNAIRRAAGKSNLVLDQKISYVSRLWSREQASRGEISHDWFVDGTWMDKYEEKFDARPRVYGENVAYNYGFSSPEECAAKFSSQWKKSSGHYQNMIGNYATIGVGVARGDDGSWYATQNFGR